MSRQIPTFTSLSFILFTVFTVTTSVFGNGVLFIGGMPYSSDTNGAYERIVDKFHGYPVYQRKDSRGSVWSLYRRKSGSWVLDFDDISDTHNGTVAYTLGPAETPTNATWNKPTYACTATPAYYVRGFPYSDRADGKYIFDGVVHNGRPVYQHSDGKSVWSLYQRDNGFWYVDFNDVSEDYDGSIGYTKTKADDPTAVSWKQGTVSRYSVVHIRGSAYSSQTNGAYNITDTVYNQSPVYKSKSGKWSFYKRQNNKWHLDFNGVDEQWDGTVDFSVSAGSDPTMLKYKSGIVTAYEAVKVAGMHYPHWTDGTFTLTETVYNGAPVYSRVCLLYTSPSPRDQRGPRMPSSA